MADINVIQRTQKIFVDMAAASVSVINAGPQGPPGGMEEANPLSSETVIANRMFGR